MKAITCVWIAARRGVYKLWWRVEPEVPRGGEEEGHEKHLVGGKVKVYTKLTFRNDFPIGICRVVNSKDSARARATEQTRSCSPPWFTCTRDFESAVVLSKNKRYFSIFFFFFFLYKRLTEKVGLRGFSRIQSKRKEKQTGCVRIPFLCRAAAVVKKNVMNGRAAKTNRGT